MNGFIWEEIDSAESQEELDYLEKYWIKFYDSRNKKHGYNLAEGGRVNRGYKLSQKTKLKMRDRTKGLIKNNPKIGFQKGHKMFHDKKKKVRCIDTGIIFDSIKDAQKFAKCDAVSMVCRGKMEFSGGLRWEYVEEKFRPKQKFVRRAAYIRGVTCVESGIAYDSAAQAQKLLNLGAIESGIIRCCNGVGNLSGGFHWKFSDHSIKPKQVFKNKSGRKIKIICIETNKIYLSAADIERELGFLHSNIASACKGRQKSAYGFHWKYLDSPTDNTVNPPVSP